MIQKQKQLQKFKDPRFVFDNLANKNSGTGSLISGQTKRSITKNGENSVRSDIASTKASDKRSLAYQSVRSKKNDATSQKSTLSRFGGAIKIETTTATKPVEEIAVQNIVKNTETQSLEELLQKLLDSPKL